MTCDPEWTLRGWVRLCCWLIRKYAELAVILLCPLTLLNYLCVISLNLLASPHPSATGLAVVQEWRSVEEPNRGSQIHNMPSDLSQTWGVQLLIFQRTLHYHSGQNSPSVNREGLVCHLHNIHTFLHCSIDSLTITPQKREACDSRAAPLLYSRINFEHKVFLLFEVRDGVENITHGEHSAAIRPSVLHMRQAFLWVI